MSFVQNYRPFLHDLRHVVTAAAAARAGVEVTNAVAQSYAAKAAK